MKLPHPIQEAFDREIKYLTDEYCEWKLELEGNNSYIEEIVGKEVAVIGNNGFGDYLFLEIDPASQSPQLPLYIFWHEGQEVQPVQTELECYLGLCPYPPSSTQTPSFADGSTVCLGDEVEFSFFFRKKRGKVSYITGLSPLDHKVETLGIPAIEIELPCGTRYAVSATNQGHRLKKSVRKLS